MDGQGRFSYEIKPCSFNSANLYIVPSQVARRQFKSSSGDLKLIWKE
jgi:hypothetical protein